MNDLVEHVIVENRISVTPHDNCASGHDYSPHFVVERLHIEPVQCLRDGDEIDRVFCESTVVGWSNAILDTRMRDRLGYLLRARIGCDYMLELLRKPDCRLASPRRAVPCEPPLRDKACDPVHELVGVSRAIPRVERGSLGEQVPEGHTTKVIITADHCGKPLNRGAAEDAEMTRRKD